MRTDQGDQGDGAGASAAAGVAGQRPAGGRAQRGGGRAEADLLGHGLAERTVRPFAQHAVGVVGGGWADGDGHRGGHVGEQVDQEQLAAVEGGLAGGGGGQHAECDLAEVAADQDAQRVTYRGPHRAAFDQGGDDRFQAVVGDDQVGGGPGGGGAALAEGDAHVGEPDGGCVVGAVAGHRHGPPAFLQGLDDPDLVGRGAAGHHVGRGEPVGEGVVVEFVEFGGGDDALGFAAADGGGDRLGGRRMVTGDHDGVDAGLPDPVDGRCGAVPYSVGDGEEAGEGQAGHVVVGDVGVVDEAFGDGEDAVSRPGAFAALPVQVGAAGVVERLVVAAGAAGGASGQHLLGCALDAQQHPALGFADAGVVAAGGFEGQAARRPPARSRVLLVHPGGACAAQHRTVGLHGQLFRVVGGGGGT